MIIKKESTLMHILLLFVVLIVIALAISVSLIKTVLRIPFRIGRLLGFGKNKQQRTKSSFIHWEFRHSTRFDSSSNESDHEAETDAEHSSNKSQKKIIAKNEGEYIDFEEVKDNSSR